MCALVSNGTDGHFSEEIDRMEEQRKELDAEIEHVLAERQQVLELQEVRETLLSDLLSATFSFFFLLANFFFFKFYFVFDLDFLFVIFRDRSVAWRLFEMVYTLLAF
jgi:hypothetical protein